MTTQLEARRAMPPAPEMILQGLEGYRFRIEASGQYRVIAPDLDAAPVAIAYIVKPLDLDAPNGTPLETVEAFSDPLCTQLAGPVRTDAGGLFPPLYLFAGTTAVMVVYTWAGLYLGPLLIQADAQWFWHTAPAQTMH